MRDNRTAENEKKAAATVCSYLVKLGGMSKFHVVVYHGQIVVKGELDTHSSVHAYAS